MKLSLSGTRWKVVESTRYFLGSCARKLFTLPFLSVQFPVYGEDFHIFFSLAGCGRLPGVLPQN
jgi:hypothetical protein